MKKDSETNSDAPDDDLGGTIEEDQDFAGTAKALGPDGRSDDALAQCRRLGDTRREASILFKLATVDLSERRNREGRLKLEHVLKLRKEQGDVAGEGRVLHVLGSIDLKEGQYARGRVNLERSIEIGRSIGGRAMQVAETACQELGALDLREGNLGDARARFEIWLTASRERQDRKSESKALVALATIDVKESMWVNARRRLESAMLHRTATGDVPGEIVVQQLLVAIDFNEGRYRDAALKLKWLLNTSRQEESMADEAQTIEQIGLLAWRQDKRQSALMLLGMSNYLESRIFPARVDNVPSGAVIDMARSVGIGSSELRELFREAEMTYRKDRGWNVIQDVLAT